MEKTTSYSFQLLALTCVYLIATCSLAMNISTDQSSLLALKAHIISDPYHILSTNWSSSTSVCDWIGITCGSRHKRVTVMNVSGMGFSGTIPPQLGNLSFLVSLDLSYNNFHGELPPEFSHLRRLRVINLSYNNFTGDIPVGIATLPSLKSFILGYNKLINGSNVLSIFNMSTLEILDLREGGLTGEFPSDLCRRLPRLQRLALGSNMLSGQIPRSISECSQLQLLMLFENYFGGTIPREVGDLKLLQHLNIGDNMLEGTIPDDIGHLYNLEYLRIKGNKLTGSIPLTIFNISSLEMLVMGDNMLEGHLPREVGKLTMLQGLDLGYNNLTGTIPDEIGHLYNLEFLNMERNELTGTVPLTIFNISSLQTLYMTDNKIEGHIPREVGNLSMLNVLDLAMNSLTGVIPDEVGNLKELADLSLYLNKFNGSIPVGIFNISSLVYISLTNNYISGNLPSTIDHGIPNVQGIFLGGNNINGVLPSSISNLSKLTHLDLGANKLTGPIPESLGHLRFLKKLQLDTNYFTGELSFITPLANSKLFRLLILTTNPLNAMLPKSIGNLSSLQTFYAEGCNLKGHLPNEIGNLRNLSSLRLNDNDFTGILPTTVSSLEKLQHLSLGANRISSSFPIVLCELPNLGLLNLSRNQLWGSIPTCLGDVTSLREVYLDSNNFTASIPSSLGNLKDILKLNLSSNFFNGSLPLEVGNLKAAILLDFSRNQISGNIPSILGGLQKLIQLSLAHNRIGGSIPETFGKLIDLEALDLSYNNISGMIPKSLEALKQLDSFNVSFNRLHGEIPSGGRFVRLPYQSFMSNEGLCGNPQKRVPACPSNSKNHSTSMKRRLIWILVASSVIIVIGIASAIVFVLMRRRGKTINAGDEWSPEVTPQRISYYELQRATQGFDGNNLIGSGSFGSVYKGILADGMIVAVKVFNVQLEGTFQTFDRECEILRNLRHRNLTKIISNCCNLDFKALILEYMPNESLDKLLYSQDYCLTIMQILNIMVDVASALEYLHHGYSVPVIHCDLKPSNVLIDKDMVGHLTDFGIAKLLTKEESIAHTTTLATIGYIAPEYGLEGLISKRSDVYSYGIMLLESFTKKKPSDEMFAGDLNLRSWVHNSLPDELDQIINADLLTLDEENLSQKMQYVSSIMELALKCTANIPVERMNMTDVVTALKKIKQKLSTCYSTT